MSFVPVVKKILFNGLTILVRPVTTIPEVSMQLWYHVGSKDEKTGQKGLAHLVEHMIFKGTDILSESDINVITHKLSGYSNAFTSYDYTGYLFNFPSQNWKEGLFLFANCMNKCRFDAQMLNSEMKAVIQELKMYRDDYIDTVLQKMFSGIFYDHPYKYPIIGFKQDLWSLSRDALFDFYKQHYIPNNATLVVVGDVDPEEVFKQAQESFGSLPAQKEYKKQEFYHGTDLVSGSVSVFRDVQQAEVLYCAVLPGAKTGNKYAVDVLAWMLGGGKSSHISRVLIEELQLVTKFQTFAYQLEDATLFFFYYQPIASDSTAHINATIMKEVKKLQEHIDDRELLKAIKQTNIGLVSLLENNEKQAYEIGQAYLMTGDENYLFKHLDAPVEQVKAEVRELLVYFNDSLMYTGQILPMRKEDTQVWQAVQELSDQEDAKILDGRQRDTQVEEACYVKNVISCPPKDFCFRKPEKSALSNGVRVFTCKNEALSKIDIMLTLKARSCDDSDVLPGLYTFVCALLLEGTKNYPKEKFAQELEQHGVSFAVQPGMITMSCLKGDIEKAFELLHQALTQVCFDQDDIEKVRVKLLADLKKFWDEPQDFSGHLLRTHIYKDHPYSKLSKGTVESLKAITQTDIRNFYKTVFTPVGARLAVVGDFQKSNLESLLQKYIADWAGSDVKKADCKPLSALEKKEITFPINRDQVVVAFAGLSVDRLHPDYEKLLLFDQIFGASSMASRLFLLREQTGFFYSINGSVVAACDEQPGMFVVKTIVSLDKLSKAKEMITQLMETVVDTLTQEELDHAKMAIINGQIENFGSNMGIANTFLHIDRFGLSENYFDNRAERLAAINLADVQEATRKVLDTSKMITLQIGRL